MDAFSTILKPLNAQTRFNFHATLLGIFIERFTHWLCCFSKEEKNYEKLKGRRQKKNKQKCISLQNKNYCDFERHVLIQFLSSINPSALHIFFWIGCMDPARAKLNNATKMREMKLAGTSILVLIFIWSVFFYN